MKGGVFERDRRIRDAALSMGQTFYLVTLNQFIGNNADAWPSQTTLAERMNASPRAVRNWQTELEALGILSVESGKGCKGPNRYTLRLDALPAKSAQNTEPHAALDAGNSSECGTLCRNNAAPRAAGIRNQVPTERTVERTEKEHSGNSANSGRASGKKRTLQSGAKLMEFCTQWNVWHSAGIIRQKIRDVTSPGKGIEDAWKRSQRDAEQWQRLSDLTALRKAIEGSQQFLRDARWFDAAGLIGGKNSNRRWYAEQLVAGAYLDKSDSGGRPQSLEASQAWQKTLEAVRRHSSHRLPEIERDIGPRSWRALRSIGGAKQIDKSNDFERRELERRFIQAFSEESNS